jgi:hypothetical protein
MILLYIHINFTNRTTHLTQYKASNGMPILR